MNVFPSNNEKKNINSVKKEFMYNLEEELNQIELLPTFNKINVAQALLKEMISIKERFDENKNNMINKIKFYCYTFYKYLILSKEINDYCNTKKELNDRNTYILANVASNKISPGFYNLIYKFLFFIRNNNKYMLKIIDKCHIRYIPTLSYFIANFCYENTICNNNSFIQEELQLIIYFLIEKIINNNPEEILNNKEQKFLYHLLKYIIRKPDMKNYLNILLYDLILKLEKSKKDFIKELIKREIKEGEKLKSQKKSLVERGKMQTDINFLKFNVNKKEPMPEEKKKSLLNRMKTKGSSSKELTQISGFEKKKTNKDDFFEKIDNFFVKNDASFAYISEKLSYYENLKEKDEAVLAFIYFLENTFSILVSKPKQGDLFRNNYYFGLLEVYNNEKKEERINKEKYIDNIKKKYDLVISTIVNLMIKIEETLPNIPKPIKNILNIVEILMKKKFKDNKNQEKIVYFTLMAKLKILIGNIILPMINRYLTNGILGDLILSSSTSDILKSIEKIFNTMLNGKLFDNIEDPEYTIYNKFIIEYFPQLINIALRIESDKNETKNSDNDTFSLLKKLTNTFDKINDDNRIINYNELKGEDQNMENIKYQTICFNWEILYILIKTIENSKELFINDKTSKEEKKIFMDILKINQHIFLLRKGNQMKKEYEYFFIDKIIYHNEFEKRIKSIIQDNFEIPSKFGTNDEVIRFKKCLSVILGYVGLLYEENFLLFINPKGNIPIYSNEQTKQFLNYQKYNLYNNTTFEKTKSNQKDKKIGNKIGINDNKKKLLNNNIFFSESDNFFSSRKSVVIRWLEPEDDKTNDIDFKTILFPQIMFLVKSEIENSFITEKFHRIIFCLTYLQNHFDSLPLEYQKNNYSKIFIEIIEETKILIQELRNNILNEFFIKIRFSEKLNEIIKKKYYQMKSTEKFFYIKNLYKNIKVLGNITIQKDSNAIISQIKFEPTQNNNESKLDYIKSFVKRIPNITENESEIEKNEDFLKYQERIGLIDAINGYFKELKNSIKNEKNLPKLSADEFLELLYGLESHILEKIYLKIYPVNKSKDDIFIYKKCERLSFLKPDNIIKDKKFKNIDEKLLEVSIDYIKKMNIKITPMDKINCFGKALNFVANSMEFNSGKKDFGVDDLFPLLTYIIIKAKPEKLFSNYNYCSLYLNPNLKKRQLGSLLTQFGAIIDIIKNLKYDELNNISKEEFGSDDI